MEPTTAVFLGGCVLLAGAGLAKLWRPDSATAVLADLGPPGWNALARLPVARLLGGAELIVAVVAGWHGGAVAAGVLAGAFLAFAAVAALTVRHGNTADCGCFGAASSPMTGTHVAVNLAVAALAASGLIWPPTGLPQLAAQGIAAVLLVGGAAVLLAGLGYLLFTALPAVQSEQSRMSEQTQLGAR